ncbi:hypothetical protein [Stieleria neptunia]|uniref:hypothetical protein n=1 Tax=Stieleria neptunia TaxID=2527979 RepID=UPI00119F0330|nr:hypothetical protein [Stieleria neptunia]
MNSPLLALLLIVNLLACPVRCLSCETTAAVGGERAAETCACCSHCDQAPVSELPAPCGDECNCQSCICEGAVIQTETELPDTDLMICWQQPTSAPVACSAGQDIFLTRHGFACTGQLRCGRDMRVAHQSWLI